MFFVAFWDVYYTETHLAVGMLYPIKYALSFVVLSD